jgi:KUP system potassium uptake protein
VHRVVIRFGFMEEPNVPVALQLLDITGVDLDHDNLTYFVGRESILPTPEEGMNPMLEQLYALLHRGAASASRFFDLPADRVFEVGAYVEI